jgi:hypothetical protein
VWPWQMESANPVFYRGPSAPAWRNGIAGELRHTLLTLIALLKDYEITYDLL